MATPLQGTESGANAIQRVSYTHDALIDLILANPSATQIQLAAQIGYNIGWISRVMCSDAFQARLAERKTELVDPLIKADIEGKLKFAAHKSLDVVLERLDNLPIGQGKTELATEILNLSTKALGFGARERGAAGGIVQNFVVALPAKAADQQVWADAARAASQVAIPKGMVVDV